VAQTTPITWLTREAYDRLTAEYDNLTGPARIEIARKIQAAREEGDLKENGGYHAAKEEQGKMEARSCGNCSTTPRSAQALPTTARSGPAWSSPFAMRATTTR